MNMKGGEKMEIKKRRGIGLTVVGLTLLFCVISTITLAGAAVVEVVPADQTVTAGESFSVDVRVKDVTYMAADEVHLSFDPSVMSVPALGVTEGGFLKTGGTTYTAPGTPVIDNTTGFLKFAYLLKTPQTGVDGSGILATINFNTDPAATPGTYPLNLTTVKLRDGDNNPITVDEINNGTVTILQPAPVPGLSGTSMVAVIGVLAIVLAISAMRKRRK